jgi:hypothetical protein
MRSADAWWSNDHAKPVLALRVSARRALTAFVASSVAMAGVIGTVGATRRCSTPAGPTA